MARVALGMSGGVDSSVAAVTLLEAGHDVVGVTLRLGLDALHGRSCCGEDEALLARHVCSLLGIPHTVADVSGRFAAEVVAPFADAYARGETPNPCVTCNEVLKFASLHERATALGCEHISTGHYARVARISDGGLTVARARDPEKDQSYFLYRVPPHVLERTLFPLGEMLKPDVRAKAEANGLPNAGRADSQEVCFTDDHVALVTRMRPDAGIPGPIVSVTGEVLGTHVGIAGFTVGQRRGLGIGGSGEALHVVGIRAKTNEVVVGGREDLAITGVRLRDHVWRSRLRTLRAVARCRYRGMGHACEATLHGDGVSVTFDAPVERVAPGQSVVLYLDGTVIAGGIAAADPSPGDPGWSSDGPACRGVSQSG